MFVSGIGLALLYCPALIIISQYFNQKRAISTAIAASGVSAGGVTLPFLMRYFVEHYGLSGGLMLLSAVMFNQAIFVALFTPPSQYTFVTSAPPTDDSAKRYSSSVDKSVVYKTQLDEMSSLQNSNSYKNNEDSVCLLEKYSSAESDHREESVSLLQQHPNGSQISTQPVPALSGDRNTGETRRGSQGRELHPGIATTVLDGKFDETVESSGQLEPLPNDSSNPNQSKAGPSNLSETNQGDEPNTLPSQVVSLVQKDQSQTHSLKDSVLRVLSTSGTDLYGSLHDVSSQRLSLSAGDQRTAATRYDLLLHCRLSTHVSFICLLVRMSH